jgi:3'(2'), 5'-bisphosphate nucleotidase
MILSRCEHEVVVVPVRALVFNVFSEVNIRGNLMSDFLPEMIKISRAAGSAILKVYEEGDFSIQIKADDSPLTRADLAAHEIIVAGLNVLAPEIPVLSEESDAIDYETRSQWRRYFLVDPLDGTKEFINRNGEFTVNIALIDDGVPILGVVYVPVKDVLYAASQTGEKQAYRIENNERRAIKTRALDQDQPLTLVASRRHRGDELVALLERLERSFSAIDTANMGSSLKLCLVAEGQADIYPRLAPTSEWDTAAAQAIVEAAGGLVLDIDFKPLRYNTKASLLNPNFLVIGDETFDWRQVLTH